MSTEFYNRNWRITKSSNSNKVSNYSMSFDGSSEYITMNDLSSILTNTDFSLSLWFKGTGQPTTANSSNMLFSAHGSGTSNVLRIGIAKSSGGIFFAATGSSGGVVGSADYDDSNWYHLVITKPHVSGGAAGTVYINGSSIGSTEIFNINFESATHYSIGQEYDPTLSPGDFFKGNIDHVAIFDYALSASQVTSLYGNSTDGVGNPMAITGGRKPIAYYPIGDYAAFNGSEYLVNNGALQDYVFNFVPNDFINVSNNINITSNFSYSLWYKSNSNSGTAYEFLLSKENASATINQFSIFHLFTGGSGRLLAHIYDSVGTGFSLDTGSGLSAEVWHHVVFCYSPSNYIRLYLDGVLKEENTTNIPSSIRSITGENIRIGGRKNNSMFLNGEMSNVQMWSGTLTDGGVSIGATAGGEVATLYNNGTPYMGTQPQSSNLQGWWKLDASATFDSSTSTWSIPDDSSNSNTGTSDGMTAANLVQSTLNITTPYSRYALNFDSASSDKITGTGALISGNDSRSFSLWYKTTSTTPQIPFSLGSPTDQTNGAQFAYCINRSSTTNAAIFGKNSAYDTSVFTVPNTSDGEWHHLLVTYDQSSLKVYLDGNLEATPALPSTSYITSAGFTIGGWTMVGNRLFNGDISNVSVWNAALTSTQVTEIYNEGKPGNLNTHSAYSNLVSWWQLGENMSYDGTKWTVLDEKGSNNGEGNNLGPAEDAIVNGVGTSANGLSSGMGGADNIVGDAPYSTANAISYGMGVDALSTDVPS